MMSGVAPENGQPSGRGSSPRAIIGVLADEETRNALSHAAIRRGIPFAFEIGGIEEALAGLHPDETADCVIVDLDGTPDAIDDVAVLATGLPPYAELVVLGIFTEDQAYELSQAGASLCLPKPLSEPALLRVFGPIPASRPAAAAPAVDLLPEDRRQPEPTPEPHDPGKVTQPYFAAQPASPHGPPADPPPPPLARVRSALPEEPVSPPQPTPAEPQTSRSVAQRFNSAEAPPSYGTPPAARSGLVQGRVITVLGCRGGVGATSIAVGLAWMLAEDMDRSTALVDLDPYFGSVALALNLDPGDALLQALERPTRIDAVFLDRAVRKVGQNLYVLSSEQTLEGKTNLDPTGPATLIKTLAGRHERVVVDLPRGDPDLMTRVLSLSDEILLVTDLSLAGARDAMRLMMLVRAATVYARVRIVGGGARDSGKSPILSPSEFRRAVGAAVDITIAHDSETASDAARSGRPIPKVFPRSATSKALRNLIQSIESNEQREQKRKLLFWKK